MGDGFKTRPMESTFDTLPAEVPETLQRYTAEYQLAVQGGRSRRTSSRVYLRDEHGDCIGTEPFGVETDRFIWLAYKPSSLRRVRISSTNFRNHEVVNSAVGEF